MCRSELRPGWWRIAAALASIALLAGCAGEPAVEPRGDAGSQSPAAETTIDATPAPAPPETDVAETAATGDPAGTAPAEPPAEPPESETPVAKAQPAADLPPAEKPESIPPTPAGELEIVLQSFDSKLRAIKVVRAWTSLGLKEAKELVESEQPVIATGLTREKAEELMEELEETGALVIMRNAASGEVVVSTAPQASPAETPAPANEEAAAAAEKWPEVIDGIPFRTIEAMIAEIRADEDEAEREYSSRLVMIRGPIEKLETTEEGDFYLYLQGKRPEDFVMAHGFENSKQVEQQFKAGDTITVLGVADVAYGSTVSMSNASAATDKQLRTIIQKAEAARKFDVVVQAVGNQENAGFMAYGVSKWSGGTVNDSMARLSKTPLTVISGVTRETAERAKADLLRSSVYLPNPQVLIRPAKKN